MLFALQVSFIVTLCLTSTCGNDVIERNTEHSNTRLASTANRPLTQRNQTKVTRDGQLLSLLAARRRLVIEDRFKNHIRNIVEITTRQNISNTVPKIEATFPNSSRTLNLHLNLSDLLHNTVSNHSDDSLMKNPSTESNVVNVSSPRSIYKTRKHDGHYEPSQIQENKTSAKNPNMPIIRNILFRRKHSYLNRKLPLDFEQITFDTLGISEINKNPDDLLLDNEDSLQVEESSHDKLIYYEKNNASKKSGNNFEDSSDEMKGISMNNKTFHNNRNSFKNNSSKELPTRVKSIVDVKNITADETHADKFDSDEIIVVFNTTEPKINHTTSSELYVTKVADKFVDKQNKTELKSQKNNTRYLSPSLYSYFRPLDVPEEEMQPFLRFGEKLPNNKFNLSRTQSFDKEKILTEENSATVKNEEEVHENMDVAVMKPIYENKIPKLNMPNQKVNVAREYYKHRIQSKNGEKNLTNTTTSPKVDKKVIIFNQQQRNSTRNRGFRNTTIFFLDRMKGLRKTIHLGPNSTIADLKPTLDVNKNISNTTETPIQLTTNATIFQSVTESNQTEISSLKLPLDKNNITLHSTNGNGSESKIDKLPQTTENIPIETQIKIKSDISNTTKEMENITSETLIPITSTENINLTEITKTSTEENLTMMPSTVKNSGKTTMKTIKVTKRIDSLFKNSLISNENQTAEQPEISMQNKIPTKNHPQMQLNNSITNGTSIFNSTTESVEQRQFESTRNETTTIKTSSTTQNSRLKLPELGNRTISKIITSEPSEIPELITHTLHNKTKSLKPIRTQQPQIQLFKSTHLPDIETQTSNSTQTTKIFDTTTPTNPTTRILSTAVVTSVSVESSKLKSANKTIELSNSNEKLNDSLKVDDPVQATTTDANDPFATMVAALSNFTLQSFQNKSKFDINPNRNPNMKLEIPHLNFSHHSLTNSQTYPSVNRTKFILKSNPIMNISTTTIKPVTNHTSTTDFIIHVPDIEIPATTEFQFQLTQTEMTNTDTAIANTSNKQAVDGVKITTTLNYDNTTEYEIASPSTLRSSTHLQMTTAKPNGTTNAHSSNPVTESSSSETVTKFPTKIFNTTSLIVSESELPLATLFNIIKKPEIDVNVTTMHKIPETVISRKSDSDISLDNVHAAYILAALGFLPMMVIVIYVVRTVMKKKHKIIEDFEAELHDSEKKTIIFPVARLPALVLDSSNRWEFPRNKLRLQTLLGQGNFGQVWKAEADDLKGHIGLTRLVAVKTIKDGAGSKERDELLKELAIMQKMGSHPNVVTLLGCCTDKEPYLLIMEYVMYGKLLTFLRDHRTRRDYYNFSDDAATLTARDLTVFAYCVARGMEYLSSKGIIHRDLAARNVLVDHNKLCKIADFGMSRDAPTGEVTEPRQPRNALPVRWMAIESLLYSIFTHKSDVWSFGVLLWEIVTLGSSPYANMSGREVMRLVCDGYRLERPNHCKPELYRVMARTWLTDPAQRPTFTDLRAELADMLANTNAEGSYVDLESFRADSTVYEIDNCTPRGNYFTVKSRFSEFECEI